jgi:hypothetical protein
MSRRCRSCGDLPIVHWRAAGSSAHRHVRSASRCFEGDPGAPDRPVRRSPGDHRQGPAGRASQAVTCAGAPRCSSPKAAMTGQRSPGAGHLQRALLPLAATAVVRGAGADLPAAAARAMRQARRRDEQRTPGGIPSQAGPAPVTLVP